MNDEQNVSETPTPVVNLEVRSEKDVSPEDLRDFDDFVNHEIELYEDAIRQSKKNEMAEQGTAAQVHAFAKSVLSDGLRKHQQLSIIFAREHGTLVGYSLVSLDPSETDPNKKVRDTYLGVRENKKHKGIGTELLRTQIKTLRGMGITQYTSNSRDEVVSLYDKLGIRYTLEPHPDNPQAKTLRVFLE